MRMEARHQLLHHLPYLSNVNIHVDPENLSGEEHHSHHSARTRLIFPFILTGRKRNSAGSFDRKPRSHDIFATSNLYVQSETFRHRRYGFK